MVSTYLFAVYCRFRFYACAVGFSVLPDLLTAAAWIFVVLIHLYDDRPPHLSHLLLSSAAVLAAAVHAVISAAAVYRLARLWRKVAGFKKAVVDDEIEQAKSAIMRYRSVVIGSSGDSDAGSVPTMTTPSAQSSPMESSGGSPHPVQVAAPNDDDCDCEATSNVFSVPVEVHPAPRAAAENKKGEESFRSMANDDQ